MKFHFSFDIKKPAQQITHTQKLLLIGSCFTENIGEKLHKHKFSLLENPNGILFNPVSVAEALHQYIDKKHFQEQDLFECNEAWHSWKHHSRFSGITAAENIEKINKATDRAHNYLKMADQLMVTLGSAWVYTLTAEAPNAVPGSVAANNHKAPASWFSRRLLEAGEVIALFDALLTKLKAVNPSLQVIFTISPVRHLREGVIENNRSKAVLIQAVHTLVEKHETAYYFPAYELVIDDLRDYRFYADDLVHPNYQATQYVWEKFTAACMTEETLLLMKEIAEINIAFQHKPFNQSSEAHRRFLGKYRDKVERLQEKHPYLSFAEERNYFAGASPQ
ncbi:GSCFA domain-containing protein [Sediminibacterium soli]|uniref:GSCFA domain-containing protein n=1 Tax=Sediminibacterium soli TaxID=2698829 RepID=UPI00137AFAAB|nr:GSCFA domain-containing protein [Sediminibacterium soli]NCI45851.1 GSCFA domain-containing protein [Sediminibacterium soli]